MSQPLSVSPRIHPVNRAAAFLLAAGLVLTGLLAVIPALTKPFTLDETEIAFRAHHILQKGPQAFVDGTFYLAHPPLYEYTVAGLFKLFGESELPPRLFGLFLFVIGGFFFKATLEELLRNEDPILRQAAGFVGFLMYAVNPLLLQHSVLLDADTSGTALFVLMFAYFFIRMEMRDGVRQWPMRLAQALAIALAFLSKEITPVFLFAGIAVYRVFGWQWKKFAQDIVAVFVPGMLLAWGVWSVYCLATGTDVLVFIKYTWLKKGPRALDPEFLSRVLASFEKITRWPLYWMSVPFFVLATTTFFRRLVQYAMTRRTRPEDALWCMALAVWVPYLFVKGSIDMMKYQHPVYPLFFLAILCGCVAAFRPRAEDVAAALRDTWWILPAVAAVCVGVTWIYASIGDYVLFLWDNAAAPRFKQFLNAYYRPLAVALGAAIVLWVLGRVKFKEGVLAASLLFCVPINAALNLNQTGEYVTGESWANYGESGHRETANYVSLIARPGTRIVIREDLQYYLAVKNGVRGVGYDSFRLLVTSRDLIGLERFLASGILDIVVTDKISMLGLNPANSGAGLALLNRYYYADRTFGSFKVLRHKRRLV